MNSSEINRFSGKMDYYGRILDGPYSVELKQQVSEHINAFGHFDQIGAPVMPYIAAWHENQNTIWYEFVSRYFTTMMACPHSQVARFFRKSILERRIYKHQPSEQRIIEKIIGPADLAGARTDYRREAGNRGMIEAVYKSRTKNGGVVWLKDQATIEAYPQDQIYLSLGCLTIVTKEMEADEARKKMETALRTSEERFRYQAIHDDLTGLYNTRYLYNEIDRLIASSRSENRKFSLIFLDIDDFKAVVDKHGHLNASQVIREIGATIRAAIKNPAYGVAYGGDEFIVVLPGDDKHKALDMANHIHSLMRRTVYLTSRGLKVKLQASFGVATFPDDADDQTTLIGLADRAMFGVKASGKNAIRDIREIVS